jgi:hypothetical protein
MIFFQIVLITILELFTFSTYIAGDAQTEPIVMGLVLARSNGFLFKQTAGTITE